MWGGGGGGWWLGKEKKNKYRESKEIIFHTTNPAHEIIIKTTPLHLPLKYRQIKTAYAIVYVSVSQAINYLNPVILIKLKTKDKSSEVAQWHLKIPRTCHSLRGLVE